MKIQTDNTTFNLKYDGCIYYMHDNIYHCSNFISPSEVLDLMTRRPRLQQQWKLPVSTLRRRRPILQEWTSITKEWLKLEQIEKQEQLLEVVPSKLIFYIYIMI
jgi:hypothetical protein